MYDTPNDWPHDPHALFQEWMRDAEEKEPSNPNAMCLATVDASGKPSTRMVLLKGHDERGFVFYTNSESRKGEQLAGNQNVSLCFYWKSLDRQVRIEGAIEPVSNEEADIYFNSRHPSSRIGAWASKQSRPLTNRQEFDERFEEYKNKYPDENNIPRPPHWNGYRVKPTYIEFWVEEMFRLHRRCVYKPGSEGRWTKEMLYP